MSTKFSIIIPCYNQDNFIYECYISILSQFYKNWEAIFINDGSTDDTEQILKRISNYDSKVKIYSKENGGLSSARNFGIQKTTGDYLLFLDCDDLLLPNCLSKIQSEIEISSNLHLIQFGYRHICQEGTIVHRVVIPEENKKLFPDILYNNLGPVHSFCVKKNIVLDTGLFDETLKSCEDWDFWLRAAFIVKNYTVILKPLVDYRMNENSMSRNSFVLYNAMKLVSVKGYNLFLKNADNSLQNSSKNIYKTHLKNKLAMCLGVAICQNKVDEAMRLYEQEVKKEDLLFQANDFKQMSSYLTFRYQTDKQNITTILTKYKGLFSQFFIAIGFANSITHKCIWLILSKHYYLSYTNKFGFFGKLFFKVKDYWFKNMLCL